MILVNEQWNSWNKEQFMDVDQRIEEYGKKKAEASSETNQEVDFFIDMQPQIRKTLKVSLLRNISK